MAEALKIEIVKTPDMAGWFARRRGAMLDMGVRALTEAIRNNFLAKSSKGNAKGFPRSNFWQDAAEDVTSHVVGDTMLAVIRKEGVRLRWKGGEVRPKPGKKALAIPLDPSVAHDWPSEYTGQGHGVFAVWPKGKSAGLLYGLGADGDAKPLWLLVSKTTHRPDPTVIPPETELHDAIVSAMRGVLRMGRGRK